MPRIIWLVLILAGTPDMHHGVAGFDCANHERLGATWHYQWAPNTPTCTNMESVPMIKWIADWGQPLGGNMPYLLGFNEPDRPDQANMSPVVTATWWRLLEAMFSDRLLVSPATLDPTHLVQTRKEYILLYGKPPRWDAVAFHVYERTSDLAIDKAAQYIAMAHAWGIQDIWLTEYAFMPCWNNWKEEATEFTKWFDSQSGNNRRAWFVSSADPYAEWLPRWMQGECNPSLVRDGVLTPAGVWYASVGAN